MNSKIKNIFKNKQLLLTITASLLCISIAGNVVTGYFLGSRKNPGTNITTVYVSAFDNTGKNIFANNNANNLPNPGTGSLVSNYLSFPAKIGESVYDVITNPGVGFSKYFDLKSTSFGVQIMGAWDFTATPQSMKTPGASQYWELFDYQNETQCPKNNKDNYSCNVGISMLSVLSGPFTYIQLRLASF